MTIAGVTINLIIVLFLTAVLGYIWPSSSPAGGHNNMNRIYQSAYSAILGGLIAIFITMLVLYGFKMDDGVSSAD